MLLPRVAMSQYLDTNSCIGLRGDSLIMTHYGYKQVKDIIYNDLICNHIFNYINVAQLTEVINNKLIPSYIIDLYHNRESRVETSHYFLAKYIDTDRNYIRDQFNYLLNIKPQWVSAKSLCCNHIVAIPYNTKQNVYTQKYYIDGVEKSISFNDLSLWFLLGYYINYGQIHKTKKNIIHLMVKHDKADDMLKYIKNFAECVKIKTQPTSSAACVALPPSSVDVTTSYERLRKSSLSTGRAATAALEVKFTQKSLLHPPVRDRLLCGLEGCASISTRGTPEIELLDKNTSEKYFIQELKVSPILYEVICDLKDCKTIPNWIHDSPLHHLHSFLHGLVYNNKITSEHIPHSNIYCFHLINDQINIKKNTKELLMSLQLIFLKCGYTTVIYTTKSTTNTTSKSTHAHYKCNYILKILKQTKKGQIYPIIQNNYAWVPILNKKTVYTIIDGGKSYIIKTQPIDTIITNNVITML